MKKCVLFFHLFTFLFFHFSFGQKATYTKQEFTFRDVKMSENKTAFRSGLEFSFKVFGKYNRENILPENGRTFPSYSLMFFITNEQGDTLIPPSRETMLQTFSFFNVDTGKYQSYSFGHNLKIPFQQFKKSGSQNIILWGQGQNADGSIKLAPFKTGIFKVAIPKVRPLEEQQIKIGQAHVSEDTKKYNDKGIVINFSANFTYDANELFSTKESRNEVIFYIDFTDAEGNPINSTYDPRMVHNSKRKSMLFTAPHEKNITKNAEIFVPYTQFYIPPGTQRLTYTIHAISYEYSMEWRNLTSGTFTVNMPPVYFAKAAITNIQARDKSYDVAGKDIPIVNIFVSPKSSSGKGYPDLFWTFGTKNTTYIQTGVVDNSLYAADDSCSFQMLEDDVLFLDVYDYDTFSFNDDVGSFTFPKMTGAGVYRSRLKSGDVVNGNIIIKRKARPLGKDMSVFAKTASYNGISGYQVWGNITKDAAIRSQMFIRLSDGTNQTPSFTNMSVIPAGANFSYFVPAWDLPPNAGFGLLCLDAEYNLPVTQKYAAPEKYFSETQDVQIKLKSTPQATQNGVRGILMEINIEYPAGITNKSDCKFNYDFKEDTGINLKKVFEQLKMVGSPICGDPVCGFKVFVPYYLLAQLSGKQLQTVFEGTVSMKDKLTIGRLSEKITADVPTIVSLPNAELSMELKFAKNWSYVNISTEYNGIQRVFVKEKTSGGKMTVDVEYPSQFAAEDDMISLLITPYEFRTAMEPIRWTFSVKDLKNGNVNLPKHKQVKKQSLKIN